MGFVHADGRGGRRAWLERLVGSRAVQVTWVRSSWRSGRSLVGLSVCQLGTVNWGGPLTRASRPHIWWGAGTRGTAEWTAEQGMNLMSSTSGSQNQVGYLDGGLARFKKTYAGEPDELVKELADDEAITAADTRLLTVPTSSTSTTTHLSSTACCATSPQSSAGAEPVRIVGSHTAESAAAPHAAMLSGSREPAVRTDRHSDRRARAGRRGCRPRRLGRCREPRRGRLTPRSRTGG